MAEKSKILLSLGAALASLTGLSVQGAEAKPAVLNDEVTPVKQDLHAKPAPNAHFQVGEDLLGFVMTKQADGTIVAGHSSHASHASHSSHASSR
ncbi:His-Xaa-Ser repeat protein HxsA2 [Bradyrhizobium sp. 1200_D9_N1_1]|uniref:His-Xaa-Ser repeat protein HxsA2 n=1 Tax=Bradyrhizobium sp. 1200_D9_N1_1 TaxID=3239013 RepID=UPI003F8B5157